MIDARKTKAQVEYQATPNKRMRCEICTQFVPTDSCKAVKGPLGERGWCKLYESQRAAQSK